MIVDCLPSCLSPPPYNRSCCRGYAGRAHDKSLDAMSRKEKEGGSFSSGNISDGMIRYIIERDLVFHSRTFQQACSAGRPDTVDSEVRVMVSRQLSADTC